MIRHRRRRQPTAHESSTRDAGVTRLLVRCRAFWLGPIDPVRLETFRVLLGISLFLYLWAWWQYAEEWLTPIGFHVPGPGFKVAPVAPLLPPAALPWFGMALFGSLVAWIIGWNTRWMSWVMLGFMTYVTFADYLSAFTLNKLFIVSLAVLALSVRGTYWSVDNRPPAPQSAWPLRILQATLLIQYGTAGWCKILHGDWLQDPSVLWSQVQGVYRTEFASWLLQTLPQGVWSWMQYASLTFELTAPLLFMSKRLRPIALVWGFGFQMVVAMTMHLLIYFSLQMLCFYVLFLNDRTMHRLRVGFGALHAFVLGKVMVLRRAPALVRGGPGRDAARVRGVGDSCYGQAIPARWTPTACRLAMHGGGGLLNA